MIGKIFGALACLVFAVVFGAIGGYCGWAIFKSLQNSSATSDWVKVKAVVLEAGLVEGKSRRTKTYSARATYAYEYQGRKYTSTRISVDALGGGGDNVGTWQEEIGSFLIAAKEEKRPITVWVNPADPTQAYVDREVRWGLIGLLVPFALAFGGVGIGSLYGIYRIFTRKPDPLSKNYGNRKPLRVREAEEDLSGDGPRWLMVVAWNLIAWPIAGIVVPSAWEKGNYGALFVVLLPMIGTFMLWVATKEWLRRRRLMAKLDSGQLASSGSRGDKRPAKKNIAPGEQP